MGESDNAEEALLEIPKLKPDMVLMDIVLSGHMKGTEAAIKLKEEYNIPTIYISASSDTATIQEAKVAEPFGFIIKPFNNYDLLNTLEMALYKSENEKKRHERLEHKRYEEDAQKLGQKIADLHLKALKSAMNPHFIFNVLNAIQYYVLNKDSKNALKSLSKFSKLIRDILEHSGKSFIKLKDELLILKSYMELEEIRFDNNLRFKIFVAANINLESVEIPAFIIQTYLERILFRGFDKNNKAGKIEVTISKRKNFLNINIFDNAKPGPSPEQELCPMLPYTADNPLKIPIEVNTTAGNDAGNPSQNTTITIPLREKVLNAPQRPLN